VRKAASFSGWIAVFKKAKETAALKNLLELICKAVFEE
jgi:hypothetical protein